MPRPIYLGQTCSELHSFQNARLWSEPLLLPREVLNEHLLILGRTGSGKSRLLTSIMTQHLLSGQALIALDPDNDLIHDVLAQAGRLVVDTGRSEMLRRVHVLEPQPTRLARYDPFHFWLPEPVAPELLATVHRTWLHARAEWLAQAIQRNTGATNFDAMPRLHRQLINVLTAVGTLVDGHHLPLADATVLLDFQRPESRVLFEKLRPRLPAYVQADFSQLLQLADKARTEEILKQTESCLNRLRTVIGPLLQGMFSSSGTEAVLSIYEIIQQGHLLLVGLRESPFFSTDQSRALANIILYDTFMTCLITPRQLRRPITLVIDEAAEFVTPDLAVMLRRGRKYGLSIVLAAQNLASFQRETVDLRPFVLSQPSTIVCMNQRLPEDLEILGRVLFQRELSLKPLIQEVERHGGIDWVPIEESSEGGSVTQSQSQGITHSQSQGHSRQQSETRGVSRGSSMTQSRGESWSESDGRTQGQARSHSLALRESPIVIQGEVDDMLHLDAEVNGRSNTEATSHTITRGESSSTAWGQNTSVSQAKGTSVGESQQTGLALSQQVGNSQGTNWTRSQRLAQVPRVVREQQLTGQLEVSVETQLEQYQQLLAGLQRQQAVVLTRSKTQLLHTPDQPDPFRSTETVMRVAEWVADQLAQRHAYHFVPDLSPEADERRLQQYLRRIAGPGSANPSGSVESSDAGPLA